MTATLDAVREPEMFERFTDRARRVVVLAQEEGRALAFNYIGTEHLLLGLIAEEEGIAARSLRQSGVTREAVVAATNRLLNRSETGSPEGHIPFTPRAKKVLELSLREALQLGHNYIGTEHLLLGLIREGEGVAAQTLVMLGVDLGTLRQRVVQLLSDSVGTQTVNITVEQVITSCTLVLDACDPRHRAAILAYLTSWYSEVAA